MTTTNTPWTTFATTDTAAPAWGTQYSEQPAQAAFQPHYAPHASQQAWGTPAPTRVLPPQYDQMFAPQPAPVLPQRPNRTNLIIAAAVAALLLIGGGITTFLLLNKKSDTPVKPAADVTGPLSPAPVPPPVGPNTPAPAPVTPQPVPASTGDLTVAQRLVEGWVALLNAGDVETAALLVCEAQQQQFITANQGMDRSIELLDVTQEGKNVSAIIQQTGQPESAVKLTLRPTNTGYFLICDGPLSTNDLNWE